ncbi:MAG: hypothetical protein NT154_28140 [Verrucomicrobia bacterium]|nr:hypothetical protein [Verrucomicrobiota bacterium]
MFKAAGVAPEDDVRLQPVLVLGIQLRQMLLDGLSNLLAGCL